MARIGEDTQKATESTRPKRWGNLRKRWKNATLKTSFMVYMLGYLLAALVLSITTGSLFAALQNETFSDAYEVSGLYVYDAATNTLVPARSLDIDDQGNQLFVQKASDSRSSIDVGGTPNSLVIENARANPYVYESDNPDGMELTFEEYENRNTELRAYEGDNGIDPADLATYDKLSREVFEEWSREHPDNPYATFLDATNPNEGTAGDAQAPSSAYLGDLLVSPTGYYASSIPSGDARALSVLFGFLTFLMFPLWFGLCIFAAARRFYRKRLEPGLTTLDTAAANIAAQNLDFEVTYDRGDELGRLAKSFETMRASLAQSQRTLWRTAEERKRLNAAFAHDLRTPLTILKGKTELLDAHLQNGDTSPEQLRASVAALSKQVDRLDRYVNAMSGLQKLEDREVVRETVAFDALTEGINDIGTGLARNTSITFALSISPCCHQHRPAVLVDRSIVGEVAENLVNNALRFACGQVDARLDVQNETLILMVDDDGPGFSAEALHHGCSPFFSETPSHDHFGLGLNIASLLCERHGGTLTLENLPSRGARVVARFAFAGTH